MPGVKIVDPSRSCSEQSVMAGEPIFGSAVAEVRVWLLIEYRDRWERDVSECPFPPAAKAWLDSAMAIPHLRVQLIRRPQQEGDLHVYIVTVDPKARVRAYRIPSHDDLPSIDVAAAAADGIARADDPKAIYLVCGHGRRDKCCALRGIALHRTLSEQPLDGELWQSSHQGGHRFAATMLYLPLGVQYGRLDPEDAEPLARAHGLKQLYDLGRYRGQTRYNAAVQTAEAWLREQEQELGFHDVELVQHARSNGGWVASFRSHGKLHRLTMVERVGEIGRKSSCDATESTPPRWYYVVRHEAETIA